MLPPPKKYRAMNLRKICLLLAGILSATLVLKSQDATISPSSLSEHDDLLGGTTVTVTLSTDKFVRDGDISNSALVLVQAPPGLIIINVDASSDSTQADVILGLSDEFDVSYPNFHIQIADSVLQGGSISTDDCPITAIVEKATLSASPPITERNIGDGSSTYLDIDLSNENFTGGGGNDLQASHLTLVNFPAGISIDHITTPSATQARVYIAYSPGDIDGNFTATGIRIDPSPLHWNTDTLNTDTLLVTGLTESVSVYSSNNLEEDYLNSAWIRIDLDNDLTTSTSLSTSDFELVNFPTGTSIESVTTSNRTRITVNLDFDGTDFDIDDTDGRIRVKSNTLTWNKTSDLLTSPGEIIITANPETPAADLTPVGGPLSEYDLDGRSITVNLTYDSLTTPFSLDVGDLSLNNEPSGLSISGVSVTNAMEFVVTLAFTQTDFDSPRNVSLTIDANQLNESGTDVVSNTTTIGAYVETPAAAITPDSWPREYFLDALSLELQLSEEKFSSTPDDTDFGLVNAPPGLGIEDVINQADSSVTVLLSFDGTDFDNTFSNVRVSISSSILVQTQSGTLESGAFEILPNIEPVVGSVSIDNDTMKIGDVVEAIISLSDYRADSTYTLAGGSLGGYTLGSLQKISGSQYRAWFTVSEGGSDFNAPDPIPVSGLRLDDLPVTGESFSGNIVQDRDLLDAHRPVVSSINIIGQGAKKIGDQVVLLVTAIEEDLVPPDSCEINLVPYSAGPLRMTFEDIGSGSYSLIYTIEVGDQNVDAGNLQAKVYMRDPAGNVNTSYPGIAPNTLSIDASVPVILSTTNTTPSDTVIIGGEVVLTIEADGSGYHFANTTEVNGVRLNQGLVPSSAGSTYTLRYPVKEQDPTVPAGGLTARIILEDQVGNGSIVDTVILDNDVAVLTTRPTALLTLGDEICINDTATIYASLTGSPPWKLKLSDGSSSFYEDNVPSSNFSRKVHPTQTTTYSIDSVWDGTGNANIGYGTVNVVVNPLPVVDILNLLPVYAITNERPVTLKGDPIGGTFFGPGVNSVTGVFTPSQAGLTGGTPHWIYYEYTDANFCFNVDSQAIEIVQADVEFHWPNPEYKAACYLDQEYTLEATNTALVTGTFNITEGGYPEGFFVDNLDNSITFYPPLLSWEGTVDYDQTFKVEYTYVAGDTLVTDTILRVGYFRPVFIETELEEEYCSNTPVFHLNGSRQSEGIFSSAGNGVVDLGGTYNFNPSLADTGENMIVYAFESQYGCRQSDSARIIIHEAPDPQFRFMDHCVLSYPQGGKINFENLTDTSGLGGNIIWNWNYGDIQSGTFNYDEFTDMQNGQHDYNRPGEREVILKATVEVGEDLKCISATPIRKYIGNTPDIIIDWNTECFTGDSTHFTAQVETEDGSSMLSWRIEDFSGTEIMAVEGRDLDSISYKFPSIDNFSVELAVTTDSGCASTAIDTFNLRPYIKSISDASPYTEDFEGETPGWFSGKTEDSPQKSWRFGQVNEEVFPYDLPDAGSRAWFTDLVRRDTTEQSWVSSPCFDFSNMRRPMISLDRKISSERERDGAVLQYTFDDGSTWHNVGAVEDGSINWYNSFRILEGPGGQDEGWTGGFVFDPSEPEPWMQSRHELDVLTGRPRVQFRIAYASTGQGLLNEGFAFDNIWIGERSRVVLIEHFTNSGMELSNQANQRIDQLVRNNPLDVIDLQYHAGVEGFTDRMNQDNPSPAGARSLYYNTRKVPYTLIDGGLNGDMVYDFVEDDLDTLDLFTRALVDPSFEIGLDVEEAGNKLDITLDLKALESLPEGEYIVYTAIVEKLIDDPAYPGTGEIQTFENVVRGMVPSAAGISLIQSWNPGDTETIPLSWNIPAQVLDKEMLNVVVFVQGAGNQVVYQAASDDPDLNGSPTSVQDLLLARELEVLIYPNPATGKVFLAFAEPTGERMQVQLFSHTGSLVRNGLLPKGTGTFEMDVSDLSRGVYFVRVLRAGEVIGTRKLLIMR